MTRKRKGLSFLCAVCAVVMMLSSCSRKKDDGKEESSEVPMVTYEAESYRIVRQQNASPELISVAVDFAERMSESVGVTMALSDGYLARGEEPDDNRTRHIRHLATTSVFLSPGSAKRSWWRRPRRR